MILSKFWVSLFALCSMFVAIPANAINIVYEATDLADTSVGQDLWKYTYTVSDYSFIANNGFSIFFDHQLYSNLEDPAPLVNADWNILVLQPDDLLPDDGKYDALSLTNGASLVDQFVVSYLWSGNGTPGAQSYEIYDNSFNVVASGITQSTQPVPEPATIIMLTIGLIGIAGFKKNTYRNKESHYENI